MSIINTPNAIGIQNSGIQDSNPYDARVVGKEILTPQASDFPYINSPSIFGVRPGKPVSFRIAASGEKPISFSAKNLPDGLSLDPATGWITGRAPTEKGDYLVSILSDNSVGADSQQLIFRVGDAICLTPPMGWNSWYVHSEGVSDQAIRDIAQAMKDKGLADYGWTYINIDDCWMGLRDPETKAILPNSKFPDMKSLSGYVNQQGFKLGIYSTTWMSTYAGYVGGSAPNAEGDYSAYVLPEDQRKNPHQVFGRYPNGIRKGLSEVGPAWFVDKDAQQFADWGIDYVKYDWKEWTLERTEKGFWPSDESPHHKTEESGIIQRFHNDFRSLDRDIVLSLSPNHDQHEDSFVPKYANLWRLTGDIHARWENLIAPFEMEERLALTRPGSYGDLDMLQIGPLGKPNRAEVVFKPSPLTTNEQYFQVTLWSILTQPLLLSCDVTSMDDFDLNLVTNHEVLAVNQDPLCSQGYRVANEPGRWEIWAKDLADGSKAIALFNLSDEDATLTVSKIQIQTEGMVRDLWRQQDIAQLCDSLSLLLSPNGTALLRVKP